MSLEERGRVELFELLEPTTGRDAAVKLVDVLPPAGQPLATAAQLDGLHGRFDLMDQRFEAIAQQFGTVHRRLDALEVRVDAVRDEVIAEFRGELVAAVSGQTRAIIAAVATMVLGIAGLSAAFAQVF